MYLQDIMTSTNYASGIVTLMVPDASGNGQYHEIKGILDGDVSFKMSNSWGSIVPNMSSLSEISQIINNQSVLSWVSSSTGAWKGTEPLTFDLTFYLVTFKRGQIPNIKEQAVHLAKLNALYTKDKFATAVVHGGYKLNLADSNSDGAKYFFDSGKKEYNRERVAQLAEDTNGLINITIGNSIRIGKLLLKEIDINPSAVQVEKNTPLYIKVNASFRTFRSLLTEDVENFFLYGLVTGG